MLNCTIITLYYQDEEYSQLYAANQDMPGQLQTEGNEEFAVMADIQGHAAETVNEPEEVL